MCMYFLLIYYFRLLWSFNLVFSFKCTHSGRAFILIRTWYTEQKMKNIESKHGPHLQRGRSGAWWAAAASRRRKQASEERRPSDPRTDRRRPGQKKEEALVQTRKAQTFSARSARGTVVQWDLLAWGKDREGAEQRQWSCPLRAGAETLKGRAWKTRGGTCDVTTTQCTLHGQRCLEILTN